jgi:ubiquinone/menaquinone biosynthesis C-methylase UbiE
MVTKKDKVVSTNYGLMAGMYNCVTRLISRGANLRSQQCFLTYIQPNCRILSIGCGAVDFNVALSHFSPHVVALDISQQMIDCSKRMVDANGTYPMEWVCTDIMDYVPERPFDVVLANYFFNTFRWGDCCKVLEHVTTMVAPNGVLCIADEADATTFFGTVLQRVCRPPLIGLHHLLAQHPFHSVYDYGPTLKSQGFLPVLTKQDVSDVVQSTIYKRSLL